MVDDPSAVTNNDAMDLGIKVLQRFVKQSKSVPLKAGLRKSFAGWRNYTARIKKNTIYAMKIASLMRRSIPQVEARVPAWETRAAERINRGCSRIVVVARI